MKIIADENIPYLRGRIGGGADVIYVDQSEFSRELVRGADALLIRTRTRCDEALLHDSSVRLVATATIGTDQIDIPWCESHGIAVASSPGCNAPAVAQYVWSALLRLGFDPAAGERLGVVGCGNIGSIVADWGRKMGAEIWVSDPPKQRAGVPDNYHTLEEIMSQCRAVTFHTPLTRKGPDATLHLCDARALELIGENHILVNAARGPVVDNAALLRRMYADPTLRVVLDVWENEPDLNRELLEKTDFGTFHIAGYSRQGKQRATRMVLEALHRTLGVPVDTEGLEPAYNPAPDAVPVPRDILQSYDPTVDSDVLKQNPGAFEQLRHDYDYRPEYELQ